VFVDKGAGVGPFCIMSLLWAVVSWEESPHFLIHGDFPWWSIGELAEFFAFRRSPGVGVDGCVTEAFLKGGAIVV
jgi:hypothetical protein